MNEEGGCARGGYDRSDHPAGVKLRGVSRSQAEAALLLLHSLVELSRLLFDLNQMSVVQPPSPITSKRCQAKVASPTYCQSRHVHDNQIAYHIWFHRFVKERGDVIVLWRGSGSLPGDDDPEGAGTLFT